ncbi:hypothetical protein LY474_32920 [Myxococcus stipitatus]|uniref:hypothetical protein n=1 Tax=Myxococcus stipitatus TaxID=83455 RepID=UPI001F2AFADC|nr:hypothetical protein [Myxococcus stipitatus]MCE9672621.1 hypothetical protein [Myxococcus stipitatus]
MSNPDWLEHAAKRGRSEPWTLAYTFERYRQLEGLSEQALAHELNCTLDVVHWMSLCRRPDGEDFKAQVTDIARHHDVEPLALLKVIRRVGVVDALSMSTRDGHGATRSLQLAARDRMPDEEKKP